MTTQPDAPVQAAVMLPGMQTSRTFPGTAPVPAIIPVLVIIPVPTIVPVPLPDPVTIVCHDLRIRDSNCPRVHVHIVHPHSRETLVFHSMTIMNQLQSQSTAGQNAGTPLSPTVFRKVQKLPIRSGL